MEALLFSYEGDAVLEGHWTAALPPLGGVVVQAGHPLRHTRVHLQAVAVLSSPLALACCYEEKRCSSILMWMSGCSTGDKVIL